jgi:ribosomal protein L29
MISEFQHLSEKISQLAELARALRRENAELRLKLTTLDTENADLTGRIEEAQRRVAALLEKIPVSDDSKEAA